MSKELSDEDHPEITITPRDGAGSGRLGKSEGH